MVNSIWSYLPFCKAVIKQEYFAYKYKFLIWSVSNTISLLLQMMLWIAVYRNATESMINGYTLTQMLQYVILSKIVESVTYASIESKVSDDYRSGNIAINLCRPIKYEYELLFRCIGECLGSTILFLPVYIVVYAVTHHFTQGLSIAWENILASSILSIAAFSMNFLISMIFSTLVFRTVLYSGVTEFKKVVLKLLSCSFFPLEFYPESLQHILTKLPFGYLRYYPIACLQGKIEGKIFDIVIQNCIWLVVLFLINKLLWKKAYSAMINYGG